MLNKVLDVSSFANEGQNREHSNVPILQGVNDDLMIALEVQRAQKLARPVFSFQVGFEIGKWHERTIESR